MSNGYLIREEGERTYFAMIPNLVDDIGLSQKAYRLYGHIKRVAGEKGHCVEGVDAMGKTCGMAKNSVVAAKRELEKAELIEIVASRDRTRPDEIVILDVWERNSNRFSKGQTEERGANEGTRVAQTRERDAAQTRERKKNNREELKEESVPTTIYSKVIQDCLATLDSLEGYPKNQKQNAEHLEKQCERHPGLDIRREVEKFRNHYEEQGFEKKHKPRARLSTWLDNAKDWSRNSYAEPVRSSVAGYRRFD